jgi:DNA-binding beta-propeller fold protein YncE
VFATGYSTGIGTGYDYATTAYNAMTGAKLWVKRYSSMGNGDDYADFVVTSPDGAEVFVTGRITKPGGNEDYATLAYDASTGATLWVQRYDGPGHARDFARSLAVSPDGSTVFVTGESVGTGPGADFATIAYDTTTGARRWLKRYDGPIHFFDSAASIAASSDGTKVFVTGESIVSRAHGADYVTVAYAASTGATLWVQKYNGPGKGDDAPYGVAVSPDSSKVFVTGQTWSGGGRDDDYGTVAYDAITGAELWTAPYNNSDLDIPSSIAVSSDGSKVFVTGYTFDPMTDVDYLTVAYDALTGSVLWVKTYASQGQGEDQANAIAVSPNGSAVFVTGQSSDPVTYADYATIAYDASTGAELWVNRYAASGNFASFAFSVAASQDGSRVFVTGVSHNDYTTVAYAA